MGEKIYRLIKGEANLTKAEFKKFTRGDLISGDGRTPEEINRFENLDEAKEALAELMCEYKVETYDENCYITEYAIEEVSLDDDGEIAEYGDMELASALWYAVMEDDEDDDWGTGSFFKTEAIEMADRMGAKYLAVIDNHTSNPVCVDTINLRD